jgi:hypothetical protein
MQGLCISSRTINIFLNIKSNILKAPAPALRQDATGNILKTKKHLFL